MSFSKKQAIVVPFFGIFVLCTGSHYLGLQLFGSASKLVSIGSFVLLAFVVFLVKPSADDFRHVDEQDRV